MHVDKGHNTRCKRNVLMGFISQSDRTEDKRRTTCDELCPVKWSELRLIRFEISELQGGQDE